MLIDAFLLSLSQHRLGGLPAKMMEKTISDIIPDIFPKILDDTSVQNWQYRIQWDILDCCMKLLQFTVVRLKVHFLKIASLLEIYSSHLFDISDIYKVLAVLFQAFYSKIWPPSIIGKSWVLQWGFKAHIMRKFMHRNLLSSLYVLSKLYSKCSWDFSQRRHAMSLQRL